MKKSSTLFLKFVLILISLLTLTICAYAIPITIGSFSPYGYDPILIGIYLPVIPFLFALLQAYKLLVYIDNNQAFSILSVIAFRKIKFSGFFISILFLAGLPYIFSVAEKDDAPGVVAIALVIIFSAFVISIFAALLENVFKSAIEIKTENDLTI